LVSTYSGKSRNAINNKLNLYNFLLFRDFTEIVNGSKLKTLKI
jgi:hypothetical protein